MTPPSKTSSKSLTQRTLSGLNWKFLSTAVQVVLTFAVGVVLARLIPPEEFGLLGITYIFLGLATVFATLGMGPAIVQRQHLTETHIRVALTLSTILGIAIACILWVLSGYIALFFGEPRVSPVIKAISVTFLLKGLSSTSHGLLRRQLKYNSLFYVDFSAKLFGYIAFSVPMAFMGYGVWSLVVGSLASTVISCGLLFHFARPPVTPSLKRKEISDMIGFGGGVTINSLINYSARNVDYFFIGKFLSATALGLYTRAFELMTQPISRFTIVISSVLFPAYAEIQNETKRIATAYFKAVNATTIVIFPVMIGMAICAEYIIIGIYGPNWAGAVTVFRILCFAGILRTVFHLAGSVSHATGRIYSEVRRQFVYLILLIVGCLIGVRYGLKGVGVAVIFGSLWMYLSMAQLVSEILETSWRDFFQAQLPGLIIALVVGVVEVALILVLEYFLPEKMMLLKLLILVSASAGVLFLSLIFLPSYVKGEMPAWIANKYRHYLPVPIRGWVLQHL